MMNRWINLLMSTLVKIGSGMAGRGIVVGRHLEGVKIGAVGTTTGVGLGGERLHQPSTRWIKSIVFLLLM